MQDAPMYAVGYLFMSINPFNEDVSRQCSCY